MDLRSHFVAYRDHLSKTALSGCESYAKHVRTKDNSATAAEYLSHFRDMARDAACEMNISKYSSAMRCHQGGMIALFQKMLEDDLLGLDGLTPERVLNLVAYRGWNWFRYIPTSLTTNYDLGIHGKVKAAIVPHYGQEYRWAWDNHDVVFDAEEMALLSPREKDGLPLRVLLEKKKKPRIKYCENGTFRSTDKNNTVDDLVDWALPLGF